MNKTMVAVAACAGVLAFGGAQAQTATPLEAKLRQGLTPQEEQALVAIHNRTRAEVKDATPALAPVTWNAALAAQAQAYAVKLSANTATGHDEMRSDGWNVGIGENIAGWLGDRLGTPDDLVAAWIKERDANFRYAAFPASNIDTRGKLPDGSYDGTGAGGSGHYLSMVWDWTREMGCGAASRITPLNGAPVVDRVLVCRYARGGNMMDTYPYYTAANHPTKAADPIMAAVWTSASDLAATRASAATVNFPQLMLTFVNGYRSGASAKLAWDKDLATGAATEATTRILLQDVGAINAKSIWGDLTSLVADDSGYPDTYPHPTEAFAKTIGWTPWMPTSLNDAQFNRVGCGTATGTFPDKLRYRFTICRFAR